MPISASFRKALLGEGYVLTLQNKSPKTLSLGITASDTGLQKSKTFRVVLDAVTPSPAGVGVYAMPMNKEIGYREGWTFVSGDSVEIVCSGFDAVKK